MNTARAEAAIGYALAVAAQADDWQHRELGPIHLLKYLYLADLAHAERHGGDSFTGIDWTFHKFGPWSQEAYCQLEPLTRTLGARRRTFASRFRDEDAVRWSLAPEHLDELDARLPAEVALPLARAVREFGDDTAGLLDHVYRTKPILNASPGERLELGTLSSKESEPPEPEERPRLSKRKKKRLRELAAERLGHGRPRLVTPDPPPRYDEVWERAMAQLDSRIEPEEGSLRFDDSVWHSSARHDPEVS